MSEVKRGEQEGERERERLECTSAEMIQTFIDACPGQEFLGIPVAQ